MPPFLAFVTLLLLDASQFRSALFSLLPLCLLLLLQVTRVFFLALDVELDERRILAFVTCDAGFGFGDVDVVDEVKSCGSVSVGKMKKGVD